MTFAVYINTTSLLGALAVSMKISTNGLHELKEIGNHQSRAKVSNWWAGSGTEKCSFKFLSELPEFKVERFHIFKNYRFSASLEISEYLATLSQHSCLVTPG